MRAKVINYPSVSITALTGVEFVKYEWRDVPPGKEAEAERHPYLEIEQIEPEPVTVEAEPVKVKPTPKPRRRTRRKAAPKGTK